jgi:FMN-dependent NADH-azoreductase
MKNILFLQSSPAKAQSSSNKAARQVLTQLTSSYPQARVITRDLSTDPLPHLGEAFLTGLSTAPEQRTAEQSRALARSDALIEELAAADLLVLAAPMHNFSVPSTLKAWLDHVVRAGRTFAYAQNGPEGLLKGKRAILVLSRGGVYSTGPAQPFDFQEPYLRAILGFIGITDIEVIRVEGVAVSAIGLEPALAAATEQITALFRREKAWPQLAAREEPSFA